MCLTFYSEPQSKWAQQGGKWAVTFVPKEASAHTYNVYFCYAFGMKGNVICIILWLSKSDRKNPALRLGKKSSINQWKWRYPNITLVRKIIPRELPLFCPLGPKTFITTLQCINAEEHVVSQRAVHQCPLVFFLVANPVLVFLCDCDFHCLSLDLGWLWGFFLPHLHSKIESEHSLLPNNAELGYATLLPHSG